MKAATSGLLSLIWIALAYFVLVEAGKRFFAQPYRVQAAAAALVFAFMLGINVPRSGQMTGDTIVSPVAQPAPLVTSAGVAVGTKCATVRTVEAMGQGNVDLASVQSGSKTAPLVANVGVGGSDRIVLIGWAAARDTKGPAAGVCLIMQGLTFSQATAIYGINRADVAAAYRNSAMAGTGFKISFAVSALTAGRYIIRVAALESDGGGSAEALHGEFSFVKH